MMKTGARLLIVDDEPINRVMLSTRLQRKGFVPATAENGPEALQMIAREHFDLVLLDQMMPEMSGTEVLVQIRKTSPPTDLPVIMVTADNSSQLIVTSLNQGANDFIPKPIDFPVVIARIQTQLNLAHAQQELKKSEERYALVARATNDGLWDWDLTKDEFYYSPRWKKILGYDEGEIGTSLNEWMGRIHPDDAERVQSELGALRSGESSKLISEHRMLHRSGAYRWILTQGLALRDSNDRPYRMAGSLSDITEAKVRDPLTNLPNRILLIDRLEITIARAMRKPEYKFAVLFIDLDRFKLINDAWGHDVGDQFLVEISARFMQCLRSSDVVTRNSLEPSVARFGGDEFGFLLDDMKDTNNAVLVAERILQAVKAPFVIGQHEIFASLSIGISLSTSGHSDPQDYFRDADIAMYEAKRKGGNCIEVFDSAMRAETLAYLRLEADIRGGLERSEFEAWYQPVLSLSANSISGFEALLRWPSAKDATVPLDQIISTAEQSGLIVPIGRLILDRACRQVAQWQKQFPSDPPLWVSVNISSREFQEPDLVPYVQSVLDASGLARNSLKLEFTERLLIGREETVVEKMKQLVGLGIKLCIDDFGTGYSSLSYLNHLPVQVLKVDRSFISSIGSTEKDQLASSIIAMAKSMGMETVAEGIESEEQAIELSRLNCEFGQGFLFSKPLEQYRVERLLEDPSSLGSLIQTIRTKAISPDEMKMQQIIQP